MMIAYSFLTEMGMGCLRQGTGLYKNDGAGKGLLVMKDYFNQY